MLPSSAVGKRFTRVHRFLQKIVFSSVWTWRLGVIIVVPVLALLSLVTYLVELPEYVASSVGTWTLSKSDYLKHKKYTRLA